MALSPTSSRGTSGGGGGTSGALTLLSTTTLGANGTFDVSGISGAYNDLVLVALLRDTATTAGTPNLRFNADSAANQYSWQQGNITATTVGASELGAGFTSLQLGRVAGSSELANSFGLLEVTIYGYAATTWLKVVHWENYYIAARSNTNQRNEWGGGLWNSTAAITQVQLSGNSLGNFVTGSQLRIYGRL